MDKSDRIHRLTVDRYEIKGRNMVVRGKTGILGAAHGEAVYSDCECYRYSLLRRRSQGAGRIAFIGLNPSTATEEVNDPTVQRCMARAWRLGYKEMVMLNLFGVRATDPKVMLTHAEPVGADNDRVISDEVYRATTVVACWGVHGAHLKRDEAVRQLVASSKQVYVLGFTKAGKPRHPLYIRNDQELIPW